MLIHGGAHNSEQCGKTRQQQLTLKETLNKTPPLGSISSAVLSDDSNMAILGREGNIILKTGPGSLQPSPV